jgi:hypothetical protein
MTRFFAVSESVAARQSSAMTALAQMFPTQQAESKPSGDAAIRFQRNSKVRGPMTVFGYDYFEDHYGKDRTKEIRLLKYEGLWGSGGEYAYEVLNFANGKMNVQEIHDAVSAIYGPVPLDDVLQYLKAAESIRVVERAK